MNWKTVHLIFMRELNDQLRDRRTLFTITILPILLYPLLGMLMMQIAQFNREHPVRVRLVGVENWPSNLPLVDEAGGLSFTTHDPKLKRLVEFETVPWPTNNAGNADRLEVLKRLEAESRLALSQGTVDTVLIVEPEFESILRSRVSSTTDADTTAQSSPTPNGSTDALDSDLASANGPSADARESEATAPATSGDATRGDASAAPLGTNAGLHLVTNMAREHSQIARRRVETILDNWNSAWATQQLEFAGMNPRVMEPLLPAETDMAKSSEKRAVLWMKVLPFVMLVWALTGAFYPAIDLCAGEKERGTLETLLSSPARRQEIVWGKLLTISVFSIGSATLNLLSMHITAGLIVRSLASQGTPQLAEALGPMPIQALGWLLLLLLPMAAFFSALALAVAALARSTKEGQYYLMPLMLVTLPLVSLPMLPSLELNLGTSLVPVSGAVFLVRSLIEGRYAEVMIHLPVVLLVTAACCSLSIRWAIRQFESESVMFRESDRWNLRLWMHQLWRDRADTASPAEAMLCGVIILVAMFFAQFFAGGSIDAWSSIVTSTVTVQIGLILTPCLLMAIFLTRSFRRALRIHRTQPTHVAAAILLGISMHPSYMVLGAGISSIYEIGEETRLVLEHFQGIILSQPLIALLLLMAFLPAICEELAFRGFIFGGLLRQGGAVRAIVVSALFFGFTHTVLQQSIAACLMGLMLGLIAWRTGGVICTIIVHAINNTLSLTLAWCSANHAELPNTLDWAIKANGAEWSYQPEWITMSVLLTLALLVVLFRRDSSTQQVVQAEMV